MYDAEDAEWSTRAERGLRVWLNGHGYKWTHLPNGRYGFDGLASNDIERFYVEVERRTPSQKGWCHGEFPWRTVTVPTRRKPHDESLLFICRADIKAAMVVFQYSFESAKIITKNTRVTNSEQFYEIPKGECLPIDLTQLNGVTIAEQNAERIRKAVVSGSNKWAKECLGPCPPYGIGYEEWMQLGDEAEKPLLKKYCPHWSLVEEPDWHGRQNYKTLVCRDCGAFCGHGPK